MTRWTHQQNHIWTERFFDKNIDLEYVFKTGTSSASLSRNPSIWKSGLIYSFNCILNSNCGLLIDRAFWFLPIVWIKVTRFFLKVDTNGCYIKLTFRLKPFKLTIPIKVHLTYNDLFWVTSSTLTHLLACSFCGCLLSKKVGYPKWDLTSRPAKPPTRLWSYR